MRLVCVIAATLAAFQANAGIEQQLAGCAAITDRLDRLNCYDELAAGVAASPAPAPAPAAARVSPAEVNAESEFGVKRKATEEDIEKVYLEIASLDKDPYGALIITFRDGQVWKQIDRDRYRLRKGETVFVKKGALGSFLLGSDSRSSTIRVRRLK